MDKAFLNTTFMDIIRIISISIYLDRSLFSSNNENSNIQFGPNGNKMGRNNSALWAALDQIDDLNSLTYIHLLLQDSFLDNMN